MYNIIRLIIIAIMITYFIGCILYFISNELNMPDLKIDPLGTFVNQFYFFWSEKTITETRECDLADRDANNPDIN